MFTFLKLYLNIIRNSIGTLKKQSSLKIFFIVSCSVLFLLVEFVICYFAFSFMRDFPEVGAILSDRLMYLFYFTLFLMLIFSNAIVAYSVLYRSKDVDLLFTYPVEPSGIFRYKFFEGVVLSSWAFLMLLIPFMTSYGVVNKASMALYPYLVLFFIPFLMIVGSIGAGITVFLVNVIPGRKPKPIIIFIGMLIGFCIYVVIKKIRIEEQSQTLEIFILNQMIPNIRISHFPFLPSYWMVEGIISASRGQFKDAFFYFLLLSSTALFFIETLVYFASRFYRDSWCQIHSQVRKRAFILGKGIIERLHVLLHIFGKDTAALITKDMKLFWRDASQYSQFLIFFGILGMYFLNIRNFSYNLLAPFWKNICMFLNLQATLLTLGSLCTRFIYPQISLEGNKFWILGLSPVGFKKILHQKFWMNVIILLFITEALIIISSRMLGISGIMMTSSMVCVFIMNFALVGLSVGLGAAFPDFKSQDPARIVSGFGGTLTLIVSVTFILVTSVLIIVPFQLFLKGYISTYSELKNIVLYSMGVIALIGFGICVASLLYGEKKLLKTEF